MRILINMSIDFDFDVIIVGAGLAGLSAAHQILKRTEGKLKVLVLEAKDRIGGRTLTIPMKTAEGIDQWDIGGQWVGDTQYHLINLLDEIGVDTYDQYTDGVKWAQVGSKNPWKYRSSLPAKGLFGSLDFIAQFLKIERLVSRCPPENPFQMGSYALWLDSLSMEEFSRQHAWTDQVCCVIRWDNESLTAHACATQCITYPTQCVLKNKNKRSCVEETCTSARTRIRALACVVVRITR